MKGKKISQKTYESASLEDYQKEILEVWPQLETRPALYTWARVVQHGTAACEGMRRSEWPVVLKEIAKTIVWWLAFIEKLNLLSHGSNGESYDDDLVFALHISATEIVCRKYPSVCPVEFGLAFPDVGNLAWKDRPGKVCTCLARKKDVEERPDEEKERAKELLRVFAKKQRRHWPRNIHTLEKMLQSVFAGSVYVLSLQELLFHLIEEIGEVSEALAGATVSECLRSGCLDKNKMINERKGKLYAIAEELADVFSWSVAVVAKVQAHLISFEKYLDARCEQKELQTIRNILKGSQHISLSEIIWQTYGLGYDELVCADCHKRPCKCTEQRAMLLHSRALNKKQMRELSKLLRQVPPN